jgi:hypothetical protein
MSMTPSEMQKDQLKSCIQIDQSQIDSNNKTEKDKYEMIKYNNQNNQYKRKNQMASDIFNINGDLSKQYDN